MEYGKPTCIDCKHGCTWETSHEYIETKCDFDKEWRSPWHECCNKFEPKEGEENGRDSDNERS